MPGYLVPSQTTRPPRGRRTVALAILGALAFWVPVLGLVMSLLLPSLAARARGHLWPRHRSGTVAACAGLTVAGLWLPALLAVATAGRVGSEAAAWLLLPLCAPSGAALLVPATLATAAYLGGLVASVGLRSPWPWALGAWAASLTYWASARWLVDFSCVA